MAITDDYEVTLDGDIRYLVGGPEKAIREQVGRYPRYVRKYVRYRCQRQKKPRGGKRRHATYLHKRSYWISQQNGWYLYHNRYQDFHPVGPISLRLYTVLELYSWLASLAE